MNAPNGAFVSVRVGNFAEAQPCVTWCKVEHIMSSQTFRQARADLLDQATYALRFEIMVESIAQSEHPDALAMLSIHAGIQHLANVGGYAFACEYLSRILDHLTLAAVEERGGRALS
jgi:hypothetical protein